MLKDSRLEQSIPHNNVPFWILKIDFMDRFTAYFIRKVENILQ